MGRLTTEIDSVVPFVREAVSELCGGPAGR
jgi:hypothetical protein